MIAYKGYTGTLEIDQEESVFYGRVVGITDVITYEGKSPAELVKAFHGSVDDYLAFCNERGEQPEQPFSGKFVVRISPELHGMAAEAASKADQSLNAWVKSAIESTLSRNPSAAVFSLANGPKPSIPARKRRSKSQFRQRLRGEEPNRKHVRKKTPSKRA